MSRFASDSTRLTSARSASGSDSICELICGSRSLSSAAFAFSSSWSPSPATNAFASSNASLLKRWASILSGSSPATLDPRRFVGLRFQRLRDLGGVEQLGGGLQLRPRLAALRLVRCDERVGALEVRLHQDVLADERDE